MSSMIVIPTIAVSRSTGDSGLRGKGDDDHADEGCAHQGLGQSDQEDPTERQVMKREVQGRSPPLDRSPQGPAEDPPERTGLVLGAPDLEVRVCAARKKERDPSAALLEPRGVSRSRYGSGRDSRPDGAGPPGRAPVAGPRLQDPQLAATRPWQLLAVQPRDQTHEDNLTPVEPGELCVRDEVTASGGDGSRTRRRFRCRGGGLHTRGVRVRRSRGREGRSPGPN